MILVQAEVGKAMVVEEVVPSCEPVVAVSQKVAAVASAACTAAVALLD